MDEIKNFQGKIVQVELWHDDSNVGKHVGIILKQECNKEACTVDFSLLESNGTTLSFYCNTDEFFGMKSVRLSNEEREAFHNAYKAHVKLETFLQKYNREKDSLEKDLNLKIKALKEFSDELTFYEFEDALETLFNKYILDKYDTRLECTGCSAEAAMISVSKEIGKWMDFDRLGFIDQEYDGEYFVEPDCPEYIEFCEKNAPKTIPELDALYEGTYRASIGGKRSLYVSADYKIPLQYGITKTSLNVIEAKLAKVFMKNPGIDEKINDAVKESSTAKCVDRNKETDFAL